MIGCSKKNRENYQPENPFEQKKKKLKVSGNRPSNNWAQAPCDSLTCSSSSSVPRILPTSYTRHTLSSVPAWFWGRSSKNAELKKLRNRLKIFHGFCSVKAWVCFGLATGRSFLILPDLRRASWPLRKGDVTRDDSQGRFLVHHSLQHCCDIVSNSCNIVPILQRCVALKFVVANCLV